MIHCNMVVLLPLKAGWNIWGHCYYDVLKWMIRKDDSMLSLEAAIRSDTLYLFGWKIFIGNFEKGCVLQSCLLTSMLQLWQLSVVPVLFCFHIFIGFIGGVRIWGRGKVQWNIFCSKNILAASKNVTCFGPGRLVAIITTSFLYVDFQ